MPIDGQNEWVRERERVPTRGGELDYETNKLQTGNGNDASFVMHET